MYSETVMDHFHSPRNVGQLLKYDAKGVSGNPSAGPFMIVYLAVRDGLIAEVSYQTYGCVAAVAAGSLLTEMVKGLPLGEAAKVDAKALRGRMGPLPLGKEQCADIAISAISDALRQVDRRTKDGQGTAP